MANSAQPVVGIAGVQAAARSSGSATRAGSKKFFLLAIRWAPLIGLLLALAFLWKDYASKTPQEKGGIPPATASTQAVKAEAKWERLPNGSFPAGVWSEKVVVFPGCEIIHASGCGTVYTLQYRKGASQWIDQVCGVAGIESDQLRVKFLTSGNTDFPMREKCS